MVERERIVGSDDLSEKMKFMRCCWIKNRGRADC